MIRFNKSIDISIETNKKYKVRYDKSDEISTVLENSNVSFLDVPTKFVFLCSGYLGEHDEFLSFNLPYELHIKSGEYFSIKRNKDCIWLCDRYSNELLISISEKVLNKGLYVMYMDSLL